MDKKNTDDLQQDGCKLQVGGNDTTQSEKRNGSIAEAAPSTLEKDTGTSKIKAQSVKVGKTQSGPLVPGTVVGHYLPERGRPFERYAVIFILHLCFCSYVGLCLEVLEKMEWNGKGWDKM